MLTKNNNLKINNKSIETKEDIDVNIMDNYVKTLTPIALLCLIDTSIDYAIENKSLTMTDDFSFEVIRKLKAIKAIINI